jgi:hypothetical protein
VPQKRQGQATSPSKSQGQARSNLSGGPRRDDDKHGASTEKGARSIDIARQEGVASGTGHRGGLAWTVSRKNAAGNIDARTRLRRRTKARKTSLIRRGGPLQFTGLF